MLARALLLGLLALAFFSSQARASGPASYPPGSGSGVTAKTCSAGDFFSQVDSSGVFTCSTASGSGDVTAVGDCASGACFDGTTGTTLTFKNATSGTIAVTPVAGALGTRTISLPAETGTVCTTGSVCSGYQASGSYAPANATYITQTADATLSAEQAMGSLGTGLVKNTTTTGVQSIYAGTSCTNQFPRSLDASGAATCASVASADITDGTIVNADVNASAAILFSKLATTNTDKLLGRDTAGGGAVEEIGLTSPLAFTGAGAIQIGDPADCTNQFVTGASANLSLTCTTATLAGAQFANQGTTTTLLHGNAAGNPSWGAIVSADITDGTITAADTALVGGTGIDINTNTLDFDATELSGLTWSAGGSASFDWDYSLSGSLDPAIAFGNNSIAFKKTGGTSEWTFIPELQDPDDNTTYYGATWNPAYSINGTTFTNYSYTFGLYTKPTVTLSDATGTIGFYSGAVRGSGTITKSAGSYVGNSYLFWADQVLTSATANVSPVPGVMLLDQITTSVTASSGTTSPSTYYSIWSNPLIQNNGAGTMNASGYVGLYVNPRIYETAGTLNVTSSTGILINDIDVNSTTPQIATQVQLDISRPTKATTNIGVRNAGSTVYTPPTNVTVGAAFTLTATATTQKLDASTARTSDTTTAINDGVADGQIFYIINADTADIITIKNGANTDLGADCALNPGGVLEVIWMATASNWSQVACSVN